MKLVVTNWAGQDPHLEGDHELQRRRGEGAEELTNPGHGLDQIRPGGASRHPPRTWAAPPEDPAVSGGGYGVDGRVPRAVEQRGRLVHGCRIRRAARVDEEPGTGGQDHPVGQPDARVVGQTVDHEGRRYQQERGHRYLAKRLGGHGDELLPEAAVGLLPVREDGQDVPHLGVGLYCFSAGSEEPEHRLEAGRRLNHLPGSFFGKSPCCYDVEFLKAGQCFAPDVLYPLVQTGP